MELVERYLHAVRFWLPKNQQDDIIAELAEDLRAQVEEREAELGRQLNEVEVEDLLRRRGSPIRVANGYLPQRSLIGPALFPVYAFVLKVVTIASLLWWCLARMIGQVITHGAHTNWIHVAASTIRPLCVGWLFSAGVTTLVFATAEQTAIAERIFAWWDPRHLPPLRSSNSIPRAGSIFAISGLACLLIFWVLEMAPPLALRLGNFHVVMTPEWTFVFWAVLALSSSTFALEIINLLRPWWTMQRATARLVLDFGGFVVFCWSMQAHFVASVFWPDAMPDRITFVAALFNLWLARVFPWAAAVKFIVMAFDVRRLLRVRNRNTQAGWNPARNPL